MLGGSTHGSSSSAHPPPPSSSSSPRSDVQLAIFLSHSGQQKPFVENLFNALRQVNHSAFLDTHSLPKGEKFPEHIKKAAQGCVIGVVVLSEDFLTSKWPMLELEILVLQRGPKAKVLPLFYKLTPEDLKEEENLKRWWQAWGKLAVAPDELIKWEQALRTLGAFNGERFADGTSESSYINRIVQNICKQVPSPLLQDLSPIKGRDRLAEEVAGYFDNSRQCDREALLVGLHGVGGLGKTTMCQIMASFYSAEYRGRCHHLEFPTTYGGEVKQEIVQVCKNALNQLTNLSNEPLNKVDNFDQVIKLMKDHLRKIDVFLAIDNVWEESSEAANRILDVGFSANSKILLTSRSESVLEDVLDARSNVCVRQLPAVKQDEAFQIFQDAFGKGSIDSLESCREQIDCIIAKFLFDGEYHALAMKALGGYVRKGCKLGDLKEKKEFLSRVAEQVENKDLGTLEKVIRIRYDVLPEHKKSMLLDIAVLPAMLRVSRVVKFGYHELTYEEVNQWLSILYCKDQLSETKIRTLIYELAQDGLVQFKMLQNRLSWGPGSGAVRIVRVHDLYSDLALREAATSSRFFICGKSNKSLEQIEWEKLERVVLGEGQNSSALFVKKMQQQECKRLQVLFADGIDLTGIGMRRMPSLCFLYVTDATLGMITDWSAAPYEHNVTRKRKSMLFLEHVCGVGPHHDHIPGVGGHLLKSSSSVSVLRLDALIQLQALDLESCYGFERIHGLDSLKNLETLSLTTCYPLESLDGLSALPRLKDLHITDCGKVKRLPDLSRLTCLEKLVLLRNGRLEKMEGASPPALNSMQISWCYALKSTPDLSGSTVLQSLQLVGNHAMKEVRGVLSSSLTDLRISECPALETETRVDLSGLTCLENLWLSSLYGCSRLVMPDISGLTGLQSLHVCDDSFMPDISGQYASSLGSLKDCVHLREVEVSHNVIAHVASSAPPNLRKLTLYGGEWPLTSEQRWKSFTQIEDLTVSNCHAYRLEMTQPNLWESFSLDYPMIDGTMDLAQPNYRNIEGIMDLACLSPLVNLKSLTLQNIPGLNEIVNSGKLKGLECLQLDSCGIICFLDGYHGEGADSQTISAKSVRFQRCISDGEAHWIKK